MRVVNYNKEMEKVISSNQKLNVKPKLLLHCCCAPCSSACIERLKDAFDITAYFYNPNMDSFEEYSLRAEEQKRLCAEFNIDYKIEEYEPKEFLEIAKGHENVLEGGVRCFNCYELRLKRTAEYAKKYEYDYFTTTLTISPLKNAQKLNEIGEALASEYDVKFLPSDFKKQGGYIRSIELSKEYNLYRQNYCGCTYSKNKNPL